MKLFVDITLTFYSVSIILAWLVLYCSCQSFFYEKMHRYGLGNRIIPDYRRSFNFIQRNEYPEPLPTRKPSPHMLRSPFKNLYQGSRKPNDTRVFRKTFEFAAHHSGHHVFCEGLFDCVITHLAIETSSGVPILLRGGAGYRYFFVVTKAKAGDPIKGTVRAYCMKKRDNYYLDRTQPPPKFKF